MLPTKGYFQDIECPYYESACNRPYCHFRHRKKTQELIAEEQSNELILETEVPTYKPTPKSELANIKSHHIPISYVPDLAFRRSDRTIIQPPKIITLPTYKPTPLSILSSANTTRQIIKHSTKKHNDDNNEINNDDDDDDDTDEIKTIREIKQNIANVEYNPSEVSLQNEINFEDLSAEFDLIDDIIIDDDDDDNGDSSNKKCLLGLVVSNKDNNIDDIDSEGIEEKSKSNKSKSQLLLSSDTITTTTTTTTTTTSKKVSNKERHKEDNNKRGGGGSSSSNNNNHRSSKSSKNDNKERYKSDLKSKHEKYNKSNNGDNKEKHSKHHRHKDKEKESKKYRERERDKRKSDQDNKRKNKHHEKTSKKTVTKEENNKFDDVSDDDDDFQLIDNDCDTQLLVNIDDDDDNDDDNTLLECYKIFQEYKPPEIKQVPIIINKNEPAAAAAPATIKQQTEEDVSLVKKRIAHHHHSEQKQQNKAKFQPSPAYTMTNRLKLAKIAQANNEQQNLMNELKQTVKRQASTLLETIENRKIQKTTTANTTINNGIRITTRKIIAPVQNVNSIQRAKAKIEEITKRKAVAAAAAASSATIMNKTTQAQTCLKGLKRVAHIPDTSLSNIPDVLNSEKSKLPINVRTRFLGMIAQECLKLYLIKEDAYNRALNEEFSCYEKCKVLVTYRNSAMLAVNRLRKEIQEREKLGLGLLENNEIIIDKNKSQIKGKQFYENLLNYVMTEEELNIHGYPRESSIPGHAIINNNRKNNKSTNNLLLNDNNCRKCSRCSKIYLVDDNGIVIYQEECIYHPLKKRTLRGEQTYLCCKQSNDDNGCATASTHVSELSDETELEGYQITMNPDRLDDPRNYAVYALDCEMCYTTKGLELTRVTIVDIECKTVYESFVKPLNPIIDYNTNFSGITKEQMDKTSTSILQVQANILHLCNSKTILIGHSLESDMKALKIIHSTIIDTSVLFPHKMGLPHKRALRVLASEFLKKIIQNNVNGHDSAEDAITCMELVIWKIKEDLKTKGIKNN